MDATDRISSFTRDGLTFDVTDTGPLDGIPVVLLHGFPTDRTSWHRVAPLLHSAGLRTYAPDQRGYSPAARPPGTAAYRLEELVADVIALVDATGHDRVHLVGHDWGGVVAWLLAGNHPERVASLVSLSTPHPAAHRRAMRRPEQMLKSLYMATFQLPWLPEHLLAAGFRLAFGPTGLPADDLDRYAARFDSAEELRGPLAWYRAASGSTVRAHRVSVPTTYVWGSRDVALGRQAAELTAEHVTGLYEFVELDAGHWLPEARPVQCAAAVTARVASVEGRPGGPDAGNTPARG